MTHRVVVCSYHVTRILRLSFFLFFVYQALVQRTGCSTDLSASFCILSESIFISIVPFYEKSAHRFIFVNLSFTSLVLDYVAVINCWVVFVRRWQRYWTILESTHSYTCQFSQVQTACWWTWKENIAKPTSDMWSTSCDKGFFWLLCCCVCSWL